MKQLYYFEALPIRLQPEQLESFTSYLTRVAENNGLHSINALAAVCFPDQTLNVVRNLRDYPLPALNNLESVLTCSEDKLLATTFYHLGKKFGRSIEPHSLPSFLADSLAGYLRYCPACLADHAYYSLAWRFSFLRGCHKHNCYILEKCTHCDQSIPILSPLLHIGVCPNCKGDLKQCSSLSLSPESLLAAKASFQELEFLLSPQSWEDNSDVKQYMGFYFAHFR